MGIQRQLRILIYVKKIFLAISTDGGPVWVTLLVIAHVFEPLMVFLGRYETIPIWVSLSNLLLVMLAGVNIMLARAKGLIIALI